MHQDLEISPVPAFEDNYIWLLRNPGSDQAAVVDPGDEDPVLEALERDGLRLAGILITHRHGDHTGGIRGLRSAFPDAPVIGPAGEPIPTLTRRVSEGDTVEVPGLRARFQVMEVPGHTRGHIAFYGEGVLFCGDTLFAAGCGRVFDGTMAQLHASLARIRRLPPQTRVYCAHEYTLANLGFAQWVEPGSARLQERMAEARRLRADGRPTVPSTLAEELETNPFLRVAAPEVRRAAEAYAGRPLRDDADAFAVVRGWKDRDYD
jgi:hydroxyacylglutathione hydrolase